MILSVILGKVNWKLIKDNDVRTNHWKYKETQQGNISLALDTECLEGTPDYKAKANLDPGTSSQWDTYG